jgi:hypothetical protein
MAYSLKTYFDAKKSDKYNEACKACNSPAFESLTSYICSNPNCYFYQKEAKDEFDKEANAICPLCKKNAYQGLGPIICLNKYCERNKGEK